MAADSVEIFMAVWTPGSYLVREFSRHVEDFAADDCRVTKTRKNRWRVETFGRREIRLSYRIYCREMSVRTNWVEDSFALLNGAATFLALANAPDMSFEVLLELPPEWRISESGMEEIAPHCYVAPSFDVLVDSPLVAGNAAVYRFEVDGVPHRLVNVNEDGVWDGPRSVVDTLKIVRQYREMWGALPYSKYVFLNLLTESGGGLEHSNSMVIMASRWGTSTRRAWLNWLGLLSHEFLHVWNVKRLRPVELGPFDYELENYTRSLWVAEGFTNYYDALMVHRAGLSTREEYLGDSLSGLIQSLQTTPGRLTSSVEQASFDAWIKLYRPDENTSNTSISYYVKGAVVAWLLDAGIRVATGGARSLDDLMRAAFARFSGAKGFTQEEFRALAEEVAEISLSEFFRRAVESTEELDYTEALDWFGLRFRHRAGTQGNAWTGAETKNDAGGLVVTRVPRGCPAFNSGLSVDDEVIAIDGFRVRADQLAQRLENYAPETRVALLVARRDKLLSLQIVLGEDPGRAWQLEVRPSPSSEQQAHLKAWLGSE